MKRIITDISGRTPVFKTIGTMADMKIDVRAMEAKTQEFVKGIAAYREDLMVNSGDLKVTDVLSERSIMEGTINPKLIDALGLVGATVENLKAFKDLGFTTQTPELAEINGIQAVAYTALRDSIKELYDIAVVKFSEGDENNPYVDAIKLGIAIAGEPFLSFPKFLMSKGKSLEQITDDEIENLFTSNQEAFTEWKALAVDEAFYNLMETPKHSTFLAPLGVTEVFEGIKAISLELYNNITNFGEDVENINFARTTDFTQAITNMPEAERNGIITVINTFNERNKAGNLDLANGGNIAIPGSIAIPDAMVGLLLHTGEVILSFDEVVKGNQDELMESIESEEVKTLVNLIATKCETFDNPAKLALNLVAMPSKFIPNALFQNPMIRVSGMPELSALNVNIGELLLKDIMEPKGE